MSRLPAEMYHVHAGRVSRFVLAAVCILGWSSSVSANEARKAMLDGAESYEDQDYARALESFTRAGETAPEYKLDSATALYNLGNTYFKLGQFQEAARAYQAARQTANLGLQQTSYFNEGNAHAALAAMQEQQGNLDGAIKAIDTALPLYENAMTLNPRDVDAKLNFELSLKKREQLEQLQQEQQKNQQNDQQQEEQQQQEQQQDQDQQQQNQKQEQKEQESPGEDQQDRQQDQDQEQQEAPPEEQQPQQAQPQASSEEMTEEEAAMLLDAMKQEEQAQRDRLRLMMGQPVPVDKNW